ncbi:Natterin-4 [Paragonimus heterotremus]|uniref:Natterin-4 n=1 Tax=Paragonimus heterotremus TaxID=100268 RepID=A0A8J4WGK9_9TREM|nr:Natterin-4 [Paragonimus heterotremus]
MARCGNGYQMTLSWVPDKEGRAPENAIEAGPGVYVCRAQHADEYMPGKVIPAHGCAYVCYDGQEHGKTRYEVLCNTAVHCRDCPFDIYRWKPDSYGHVPEDAVAAGVANDGAPLFIARGRIDGETVVGKLHLGHQCAYFPYGGEEVAQDDYEVLVWMK